jgi:hypothetical protein
LSTELHQFIRKHGNLTRAWQTVSANSRYSSSPYVKDEAKGFAGDEQRRIRSISARLQHGTYKFSRSRGVAITSKGKPGKVRPIVISKVEDRVVQRCLLNAMVHCDALRERAFQPYSFGGIPKKGREELGGVTAAVKQLLDFVHAGATHIMVADIEGFFTKISKAACLELVRSCTTDIRFLKALENAIHVDLENSRQLWKHKDSFPYGDLGIGQGNCLSPFLGNLILSDFDAAMNEGDCHCIRYIDDIIIVAPSGAAASARFRRAQKLLSHLGMRFAPAKSSQVPIQVESTFEYLGIEFSKRLLRPSQKSRKSILARTEEVAAQSLQAMRKCKSASEFDPTQSIPKTLNRISGMAKGWAHHYAFCNDRRTIESIDELINETFLAYVGKAQKIAEKKERKIAAALLGYRGIADVNFKPLSWPFELSYSA